jgi:rod shape-determining protein MreD
MKPVIALMKRPALGLKSRGYKSRLNREQSPISMMAIPILSVLLGSMMTTLPIIETQAILPPFGLMMLIAWRLLRPGFWPAWAGLPLGIFDDIFSGAPFGSAALLWSLAMIAAELIDARAVWRDHWQDWFIASLIIIAVLIGGWVIVGFTGNKPSVLTLMPQILLSLLFYPMVVRIAARLDQWRLAT